MHRRCQQYTHVRVHYLRSDLTLMKMNIIQQKDSYQEYWNEYHTCIHKILSLPNKGKSKSSKSYTPHTGHYMYVHVPHNSRTCVVSEWSNKTTVRELPVGGFREGDTWGREVHPLCLSRLERWAQL